MNTHHKRRFYSLLCASIILIMAASLILFAFKKNLNVFLTPSDVQKRRLTEDYRFRLGGLVEQGSLKHDLQGLGVTFTVTDLRTKLTVRYVGVLPDLFRPGKGVVAEGSLKSTGIFIATEVLAKHDENYMPANVAQQIKSNNYAR